MNNNNARFDHALPGLVGERRTLRETLQAMGDHTFDVDAYINSEQGRRFLDNNVLLDHSDGMGRDVLSFWRQYGRGLVKQLHDEDTEQPWYAYVPVSSLAPVNAGRRYPMILQVNRKPDTVAETYGHVFEAAVDEVIVVVPKYRDNMPGFVLDPSKPVFGRNQRDLPSTDDIHDVIERAAGALPVDRARIYVAGFSFPGFRAVAHALNHPEQVAGVILNAFVYPYVWDLPGEEIIARATAHQMPVINIAGLCDYGHPFPLHLEQHGETNNGHDHDRTVDEAVARAGLWPTVNDAPVLSKESLLATGTLPHGRRAERTVGYPSPRAASVAIAGTDHHIVDITSRDGVVRTRMVAIENCPHWPHGSFAKLGWDFIRHFSRDPVTGKSVWDGEETPLGLEERGGRWADA